MEVMVVAVMAVQIVSSVFFILGARGSGIWSPAWHDVEVKLQKVVWRNRLSKADWCPEDWGDYAENNS